MLIIWLFDAGVLWDSFFFFVPLLFYKFSKKTPSLLERASDLSSKLHTCISNCLCVFLKPSKVKPQTEIITSVMCSFHNGPSLTSGATQQVSQCFLMSLVLYPWSPAPGGWLFLLMSLSLFSCSLLPLLTLRYGLISAFLECCTGFSIPLPVISIALSFPHFQSIFHTVVIYKANIYINIKPTFIIMCLCVLGAMLENWHI